MVLITKDGFQHLCALWRVGRSVGRVWAGGGEARQGERDQWLDLSWPLIWAALWDSWLFFCYPFPQRENFFSESTCWCCWKYKTISAHSSKLKTILPPKSSVLPPGGNQGWRETLTVTNYKCSRVSLWTDSSESAAIWETQVWSLGREDPLEKGIITHSSILAWRIPWTEEPGGLQSMGISELDTTEWLTLTDW